MKRNRHYPNNFFLELFLGRERERETWWKRMSREDSPKNILWFLRIVKTFHKLLFKSRNAIQLKMENKNWKMFLVLVYSLFAHLPSLFTVTVSLLIPKLFFNAHHTLSKPYLFMLLMSHPDFSLHPSIDRITLGWKSSSFPSNQSLSLSLFTPWSSLSLRVNLPILSS